MIQYTKEEFLRMEEKARQNFKNESNKLLKEYKEDLTELENKDATILDKIREAFQKKENFYYQLKIFIENNYPKSDEIFLANGLVQFTVDTAIHFNLAGGEFFSSNEEFQKLYLEFYQKIFSEEVKS